MYLDNKLVRQKMLYWRNNSYNASLNQVAKEVKLSRSYLSQFVNGRRELSQTALQRVNQFVDDNTVKRD